jgi:hypothetical protein
MRFYRFCLKAVNSPGTGAGVQKPEGLTTFSRSDHFNCIYLCIKFLTQTFCGHCTLADSDQGHWLFQLKQDVTILLPNQ